MYAEQIFKGKISDEKNSALPSVSIFIPETNQALTTDENGKFFFASKYSGIIRLQCSMLGYQTVIKTVDLSKVNENITIKLQPNSLWMNEVVITSNQTMLQQNVPYKVDIVRAEELSNSGKATIMEKLESKPGVDLISGGSGISKPVIRGLSFNRIVLSMMGTRIENQQWDDDHDAGIAEAGIDRIEIIYGPSALVYGADALGGALIFADEKPAPSGTQTGTINLAAFSNTYGLNADIGLKQTLSNGLFYITHIGNQSHADYRQGAANTFSENNYATNSRYNNLNVKTTIGLSRKSGVSKVNYSFLQSLAGMVVDEEEIEEELQNGNSYDPHVRSMQAPSQEVNLHVLSFENTFLSGRNKWNINAAYQSNNRKEFEPVSAGEPKYMAMGLQLHTFTYDVKLSTDESKKARMVTGVQGMIQQNKNFGNNIAVPDANVEDHALYSLAHYNTDKWNFLAGGRVDFRTIQIFSTDGIHEGEATLDPDEQLALETSGLKKINSTYIKKYLPFSFSIGTAYHPLQNISLKTNIATGFSAPNYAELSTFGKHEGTLRFEIGSADLKAEQNIETDINAEWNLKNITLNAGVFYNHINNYIFLNPTNTYIADLQIIEYQQNDAIIKGLDFGFNIHPQSIKWVQLNTTYSMLQTELKDHGHLPYIPSDKVFTELTFQKSNLKKLNNIFLTLSANHHFDQNSPALYETSTDGYTIFNVNLGVRFKVNKGEMGLTAFCTNIFDLSYFNHLSILKDIGIYEMGRNAGLKIHMTLD